MRAENIERLNAPKTGLQDPDYLVYTHLFRDLTLFIQNYASGDVLDIGCGNKPYQSLFKNISSYIGCDIVQSSEKKVDVICPSTAVPLADGLFDTVFSTQVLEHVENHEKMLQEAFRLLKPGGRLIISVPMTWPHHEIPFDFFRFTRFGLNYLLQKVGFLGIEIKQNGGKWATIGQLKQTIWSQTIRRNDSFWRKILKIYYRIFLKFYINAKYSLLEILEPDDDFITLNFVAVATKPA